MARDPDAPLHTGDHGVSVVQVRHRDGEPVDRATDEGMWTDDGVWAEGAGTTDAPHHHARS
jgi:hypothetical protein